MGQVISTSQLYAKDTVVKALENEDDIPVGTIGTIIKVDEKDLEVPYLVQFQDYKVTYWMRHSEVLPTNVKTEFYGKPVNFLGGNKWCHVYEFADHSYTFLHEPKWDDFGIGILPFRRTENGWEFLAVREIRPVHGNEHRLYALTGGHDDKSITVAQCAIKELKEETGYIATEEDIVYLGEIYITKMSTGRMALFAVDVTDLQQGNRTTDGSTVEESAYPEWINYRTLCIEGDNLLSKMMNMADVIFGEKEGNQ